MDSEPRRYSTNISIPESAYQGLPIDLALMPVRCYSCGKIMNQLGIEDALDQGIPIRTIMDEMGYIRICCRRTILTSVPVVARLEQRDHQEQVLSSLGNLSVQETAFERPQPMPDIHILQDVPPEVRPSVTFPQLQLAIPTTEEGPINAFDYYMSQVVEEEED